MTEAPLYERLRSAILTLDLAPGERVSERGLEPKFGASRTPIRAALMRLEAEGLVRRDGKAWAVSPLDIDEITALFEYRRVLETATVRLACSRASEAEVRALHELAGVDASGADTPENTIDRGTGFHLSLARLAGNDFLAAALEGVMTRLYRTRWLEVRTAESRKRARDEHEAITQALLAGDGPSAELAVIEHLTGSLRRLLTSLESSRTALRASGIRMTGGE